MNYEINPINPADIECVIFDFGFTLSSDVYVNVAPPGYPDWQALIQQRIFSNEALVDHWMAGAVTIHDIAGELAPIVDMEIAGIVSYLELGCQNLNFNEAVWGFAMQQRAAGRKTAIVTGNMDVFTKVVVPCHKLGERFDVIINSFDYGVIDKNMLWPKAFEILGNGMGYRQSLLIEDGANNVRKFRANGGYAHQYENDELFLSWLEAVKWQ